LVVTSRFLSASSLWELRVSLVAMSVWWDI
jgi:hypothetical protein